MPDTDPAKPARPKPPLSAWAKPHAFHPDYGFFWYSQQDVALVTQATVTWGTPSGGRVLSDWIDAILRHEADAVERAGGISMLHDWRILKGYAGETRVLINDRIRQRKAGYARDIVQVVELTPFWRMALQVTNVTFALVGMKSSNMTEDMGRAFQSVRNLRFEQVPAWL